MRRAKRVLLAASVAYLANAVPAAWISVRDQLPAEPLGMRTGLGARRDLIRGNGTALCAPAPMLVALGVTAVVCAHARDDDRLTVAILTGLGAVFIGGMVAEPVAHEVVADPRARPERTAVVAANVALPAAMVVAGLTHLAGRRDPRTG